MARAIKDKLEETGEKISEAATRLGHKAAEKAEEAADWTKEKMHQAGNRISETAQKVEHKMGGSMSEAEWTAHSAGNIREHQQVVASCGTKVGTVDRVEGSQIKLAKHDSPDGLHHMIPTSWVKRVDGRVELDRDHLEVQREWQPA
jgi:hypothetical protein